MRSNVASESHNPSDGAAAGGTSRSVDDSATAQSHGARERPGVVELFQGAERAGSPCAFWSPTV